MNLNSFDNFPPIYSLKQFEVFATSCPPHWSRKLYSKTQVHYLLVPVDIIHILSYLTHLSLSLWKNTKGRRKKKKTLFRHWQQPLALALSAVELDSQTFQNRPFHKPYTPTKSSFDFSIESDRRNATTLKSFYDLTGKLLTLDTCNYIIYFFELRSSDSLLSSTDLVFFFLFFY